MRPSLLFNQEFYMSSNSKRWFQVSDEVAAASILANLFDGGPKSEIAYKINDGQYAK